MRSYGSQRKCLAVSVQRIVFKIGRNLIKTILADFVAECVNLNHRPNTDNAVSVVQRNRCRISRNCQSVVGWVNKNTRYV